MARTVRYPHEDINLDTNLAASEGLFDALFANMDPAQARLPSILSDADRCYDGAEVSHAARWRVELPDLASTKQYLVDTLETTLDLLDSAPDDDAWSNCTVGVRLSSPIVTIDVYGVPRVAPPVGEESRTEKVSPNSSIPSARTGTVIGRAPLSPGPQASFPEAAV